MSRNPLIFGLFTRKQVVEKVGSGIPRMRRLMMEAGLPEPKFDTQRILYGYVYETCQASKCQQ